jgi:hypothetical protein
MLKSHSSSLNFTTAQLCCYLLLYSVRLLSSCLENSELDLCSQPIEVFSIVISSCVTFASELLSSKPNSSFKEDYFAYAFSLGIFDLLSLVFCSLARNHKMLTKLSSCYVLTKPAFLCDLQQIIILLSDYLSSSRQAFSSFDILRSSTTSTLAAAKLLYRCYIEISYELSQDFPSMLAPFLPLVFDNIVNSGFEQRFDCLIIMCLLLPFL